MVSFGRRPLSAHDAHGLGIENGATEAIRMP
jgi:hypothetical protein